jgi:hypothetical protein
MSNATPDTDRWLASFREIVRQELARRLLGEYEYEVVNVNGPENTVDCIPVDSTTGAPSISGLVIWTGLPGSSCTPTIGSHLSVVFLDCNPAKPRVRSYDATATLPGLEPQSINIGGLEPSPPVPIPGAAARVGDAAGPFLITTGSSRVSIG